MNTSTALRHRIASLRDQVREQRRERAEHLALQRELATYRTPREVDDLLGVLADQDGRDAQQVRDILLDNLRPTVGLGRTF
jgi:hypothetical protein